MVAHTDFISEVHFYFFIDWFVREREREVGVPLTHGLIGWFLYVSWPGMELTTFALAYGEDALANSCPARAEMQYRLLYNPH